jgi:hypothetical protein
MSKQLSLCMFVFALMAGVASAGEITTYTLDGRRDAMRGYKALLDVEDLGGGKVGLYWREEGPTGLLLELRAQGVRSGPYLRVVFPTERGASGRLQGLDEGRVNGFYRVVQDKISGVLIQEKGDLGWRFAIEKGGRLGPPPGFEPAGKLAFKRVVLCLDGIPHRVLTEMVAKGSFKGFRPPTKVVAVFPSLSAIAWGRLFGLPADPGYQVQYYSNDAQKAMKTTMKQMLKQTMRIEKRVHHRHTGLIGHALAYMFPYRAGRSQIRKLIRDLREHKGSRTAFVYAYQTDAIAHMEGREKLVEVLAAIDEELSSLRQWFRDKHGEELEVAIASDHGHTLVSGELIPIKPHLAKNGWKLVEEVKHAKEVNFSSAGILSSIALHCQEEGEAELAKIVATLKGVGLCTYDVGGSQQFVVGKQGVGRFDYDAKSDRYSYAVVEGRDPIGYQSVFAKLAKQGKLDRARRAKSRDIFTATSDHAFPDAPHRIRIGHKLGGLVMSPANVLVSLEIGHENSRGMTKKMASLSPGGRSGTHGSLAQPESQAVFATNFLPTYKAIRPEDLPKLIGLQELHSNRPALEVSPAPATGELIVEARASAKERAQKGSTVVEITVRRKRFLRRDPLVWKQTFAGKDLEWVQGAYRIPAPILGKMKKGKGYKVTTVIVVKDAQGKVLDKRKHKVTVDYRGSHQVFD